jgi:hypothetical protein
MYAYIDESGNTGANLFDPSQPNFFYGALITKRNFDEKYDDVFKKICDKLGVDELHAGELGIHRLEVIASHLLKILQKNDAKFHLCNVTKVDMAIMKLYDAYFDSGENLAIPPHVYNLRPLRILLLLKFALLLDIDLIKEFWKCFLLKNKEESQIGLNSILNRMRDRIDRLPDIRSRDLIGGAITWAIENPEAIYTYSSGKRARYSHLPNVMAFPELLNGIEQYSARWGKQVIAIKHDRQDQFKTELQYWHALLSNGPEKEVPLFGGETFKFQRVKDSQFIISKDSKSSGLQMIDIVLWLYARLNEHPELPSHLRKFVHYCLSNSTYYELSLSNCHNYIEVFFHELNNTQLSDEDIDCARTLLDNANNANDQLLIAY